jgi:hypothetical protein
MNELDDEATLLRRSNTRLSRRSSFKFNNSNTSNNAPPKNETANLFNFLNSGLEQSRELPSLRNSMTSSSNTDINKPSSSSTSSTNSTYTRDTNAYRNNNEKPQIEPTISLANIKRYSSTGSLNTINRQSTGSEQNSIQEIPEENIESHQIPTINIVKASSFDNKPTQIDNKPVNTNFISSGTTSLDNFVKITNKKVNESEGIVFPITLRRSMSTTQADNLQYKNRREISSEVLSEETTEAKPSIKLSSHIENSLSNSTIRSVSPTQQLKTTNRLSGLKKLGSLYKTFEDDDVVPLPKRQSTSTIEESTINSPIITNNENIRFFNITNSTPEVKYTNINLNQENKSNSFVNSPIQINQNDLIIRPSSHETISRTTSNPTSNINVNNIQINRINNRIENPFKNEQIFNKKTPASSIEINEKPSEQLVKIDDNKVKSLSKNWETTTTTPTENVNNNNRIINQNNFTSKPISINKLNSNALNKFRTNSDGNENEISLLLLQNSEVVNQQPIISSPHNSIIQAQLNKLNLNPSQSSSKSTTNINPSIQQTKRDQDTRKDQIQDFIQKLPRQHSDLSVKNNNFHTPQEYLLHHVDAIKKSSTPQQQQQQQQQVSKVVSNIPTIKSNNYVTSSPPSTPPSNDENSETSKRKSISALYLSDTASTKAKKSEMRHKETNVKTVLSLNSPSQVSPISAIPIINNFFPNFPVANNNIVNSLTINRRPSLNNGTIKKPVVNINMTKETIVNPPIASASLQSFSPKNNSNISLSINCSSQNSSNQTPQPNESSVSFRVNDSNGDGHKQKTSVFDRLSRTIKKQHDIH